jgi:putative acetyltransferase
LSGFKPKEFLSDYPAMRLAAEPAHPFFTTEFLNQEPYNVRNVYVVHVVGVTEIDGTVIGFITLIDDEIGGLFLDQNDHALS